MVLQKEDMQRMAFVRLLMILTLSIRSTYLHKSRRSKSPPVAFSDSGHSPNVVQLLKFQKMLEARWRRPHIAAHSLLR